MNRIFVAPLLLSLVVQAAVLAGEPNTLSQSEALAGWKLLFDGKSTSGWRNYKSDTISNGWVVEDGALVRKSAKAGDIITLDQYDSFELLLDFKISPAGNSGVMFHVAETETNPWMTGPEVQVQDNLAGHDPQKAGWLYQLYQPKPDRVTGEIPDATRPAGEWNQIYLRITPESCEIDMNGVQYATFKMGSDEWNEKVKASKFTKYQNFGKTGRGHICLQDHNDLVSYRNIKIRELKPGQPAPNPVTGELPLKPELAFPQLKWAAWEPVDEQGRPQAFRPIVVTSADDGRNRLFVAEQHGAIWNFEARPDVASSKLFLDIRDRVQYSDRQNEEGLLGLAFHPKYKENGSLYVYYTARPGMKSVISRFQVSRDDPDRVDPASEHQLLTLEQPFWNHNGGTLVFGPDGYLYVGLGDGGAGNDPYGNGQNLGTLLGSILRIDVDHPADGKAYGIPRDNPFVNRPDALPEIFAYGFRNLWRIAFDRKTGRLWGGDVGQNLWEEIDLIEKGGNYGWNRREGTHPFGSLDIDESQVIEPIWEYDHQVGKSITGGLVYRGTRLPELVGKYVYADYVTGRIWALQYDEAAKKVVSNEAIPSEKLPIITFGDDAQGEIYFTIVSPTGNGIYQLVRK